MRNAPVAATNEHGYSPKKFSKNSHFFTQKLARRASIPHLPQVTAPSAHTTALRPIQIGNGMSWPADLADPLRGRMFTSPAQETKL